MEKRYQVFVSSTYADLKDERSKVIQTIMEMDCIPAGMELFPAIDDEQFNFIKKVIDDCDYYIVVIGGRYGSVSEDGLSYTEKEFDYAIEKGIKVIALLHNSPEKLSIEKSDIDPSLREKLSVFREKVATQRLVKFWVNAEELPGLVALSLSKTIKTYPAVGWVRSNSVGNTDLLIELNDLRKINETLKEENEKLDVSKKESIIEELAGLDDEFVFLAKNSGSTNQEIKITWGELFYFLAPKLMEVPIDSKVKSYIGDQLLRHHGTLGRFPTMDEQNFQTLKIHLSALNLVQIDYSKTTLGGMELFWKLTKEGENQMKLLRSVKK